MTARYLSPEWFASVRPDDDPAGPADITLEQVVRGTPDGTVTYRVEVSGGRTRIVWPVMDGAGPPDLRITTDWPTAVAVAQGELSTQRALMDGLLRVSGTPGALGGATDALAGVDPVPAGIRQATTFEAV